jgi:hypothetical protein
MAITQLLAPTTILSEGAITATATMSSIPAAVLGNRVVVVTFAMYNGGGTSLPPTAITCGGQSGTFIEGDTTAQQRTTTASYMFFESQIAAISGQTLTSSTGVLGSQKSITVEVYDDVSQIAPTNKNKGYLSASGAINLSLTRAANSRTIVKAFTSSSGTALTFSNPTRTGTSNFTSRWLSYASTADSAGTSNTVVTGVNYTSAHVFNLEQFPAGTIDSTNGSTYGAVKAGSTGNVVGVSGFTPTSGSFGGKAISALTPIGGNQYTFTSAPFVDGESYPEPETTQTFILTDGAASPTANVPLESPNGMTSVVMSSPVIDDARYPPYWMKLAGYEPVDGDRIVYITADCAIAADGGISDADDGVTTIWLWQNSGDILRSFTMTIGAGVIVSFGNNSISLGIGYGIGI